MNSDLSISKIDTQGTFMEGVMSMFGSLLILFIEDVTASLLANVPQQVNNIINSRY